MDSWDIATEKTLFFAVASITLKNLCDLLIKKGIITEEEYKKIVNDANNSLKEAFMEE